MLLLYCLAGHLSLLSVTLFVQGQARLEPRRQTSETPRVTEPNEALDSYNDSLVAIDDDDAAADADGTSASSQRGIHDGRQRQLFVVFVFVARRRRRRHKRYKVTVEAPVCLLLSTVARSVCLG